MINWTELQAVGIQQKPKEFLPILDLIIENKYSKVLEIGSYTGGTTKGFLSVTDFVVTVDIVKRHNLNERFIEAHSHADSTVAKVKEYSESYDVLFIDGDHTYEGCIADYYIYNKLVRDGGMICFHDIIDSPEHQSLNCYVSKVWSNVKNLYPVHKEFIDKWSDNDWGGIGVVFKKENP